MSDRNQRTNKIRKLTVTAIMSALGFVLMVLGDNIPLPFMPSFIKLDISELPALITSFAFGPLCGIGVCFLKNLLHLIFFFANSSGVGDLANFLLGIPFVAVAGLIYKYRHNRKSALIGALTGDAAMAAATFFVNRFLIYPLYIKVFAGMSFDVILGMYKAIMPSIDSIDKAILIFNVPFTFAKGLISVFITFMIYHSLSPILKGKKTD